MGTDPLKTYLEFNPMTKPRETVISGTRVGVWDGHGKEYYGLGTYVGDEYYNSPQFGTGTYPKIEMDDKKVYYGCETWWMPLDMIPLPVKQHLGIKE